MISDTHWFHEDIVDYCDRPYDHAVMMVKRWQRTIKPSDTVLHLGDLFLGGQEGYEGFKEKIAPELPGRKFLILGNHDYKRFDYEALGFTVIKPFMLDYRNFKISFDHYPRRLHANERRIHVHGHIHNHGYSHDLPTRDFNINVSVEMHDYRPQRMVSLLNREIARIKGGRPRYYNSRHVRFQKRKNAKLRKAR